jgi:hypothetical protein
MNKGHDFNFIGGDILSKIGAAWFVSYAYYNHVDDNHLAWSNSRYSKLSIDSRAHSYNKSKEYHFEWLNEVLKMTQLDKHKNKCGLVSTQVKTMAAEILLKMLTF